MTPFVWRDVTQFQIDPVGIAIMVVATVAYLVGAHRVPGWSRGRRGAFIAGMLVTFLAVESVVGVFDSVYFSDHMIQHLLLIMVAAPLFALSAPLDLLRAVGGSRTARLLDGRVMTTLLHPLVAFALYFVFIPVAHLTGLYNEMLRHDWIHQLEHVAFLAVGYDFFRTAFGLEEGRRIAPGLRLIYVMAAVPVDTFTGLALAMGSHNPFPAYRSLAPAGSTSASILANVHFGGAIMWIGGDALMLALCIPIAVAWVRDETRKTAELDARLDALGL